MAIHDYRCVICTKQHEFHDDEVQQDTSTDYECDVFIASDFCCDCGNPKLIRESASAHIFGAFRSYSYHLPRPDSLSTKSNTYKDTTEWEASQWQRTEKEKAETSGNLEREAHDESTKTT